MWSDRPLLPGIYTSKEMDRHNLWACKKKTTFTFITLSYSARFSDALRVKPFEKNGVWMLWMAHVNAVNTKMKRSNSDHSTADLKSAEKTDNWKCFPFFDIPIRRWSKVMSNIAKYTFPFNFFVKSLNLPFLKIFSVDFNNDPEGILKKRKHFKQAVFYADFKSAVKILIWAIWNF